MSSRAADLVEGDGLNATPGEQVLDLPKAETKADVAPGRLATPKVEAN